MARSRRQRIVARTSVAAALALATWGIVWSPLLRVHDVRVLGATHTTPEDVMRVADLDSRDNLLLLSTSLVAARAETLPWVKSAEVDRMLPGTVRVRIVERRALLVLSLGAARWSIDGRGHVLQVGEAKKGLPVLSAVEEGSIEPGVRLESDAIASALKVWRLLPRSVRARVAAVFAPSSERITLELTDGLAVRYGGAHELAAKNEVLMSLLRRVRSQGLDVSYIDVRAPTSPAVAVPALAPAPVVTPSPTPSPSTSPSPSPSPDEEDDKGNKKRDTARR